MTTIADIRTKFPQYKDVPDQQLADAFHKKYYSDMPVEQFYKSINFTPAQSGGDGFFTQKGKGGLADYLPDWATNALQGVDDVTAASQDTATRGFGNKVLGPNAQADAAAARERLPTSVELPADIITSIATSPYRIGSVGAGALAGGIEGAANEYGHQPNWIPSPQEGWDIAKSAVTQSGLGAGVSKLGEWAGKGFNALKGKWPYATPDELYTAADKAAKRKNPGPKNRDLISRGERMKQAEMAQTKGREGFKDMLEGMNEPLTPAERLFGPDKSRVTWPREEQVQASKIAHEPNTSAKWLEGAGKMFQGGTIWGGIPIAKATAGVAPVIGTLLRTMAQVQNGANQGEIEALKKMILDSSGRMKTDKASIDLARDFLAKSFMQGGETVRGP